VLNNIARREFNTDMAQPVLIHLITDGHPTDDFCNENLAQFRTWLVNRRPIERTFVSIMLCTDDEEVDRAYRPFEYNPGVNRGIRGVDVTEDFRGEKRDIVRTRGRN